MIVAHGQMAAGELDDRMNAFYDGKYDVLLATTIVESRARYPDRQHDGDPPRRHVRPGAALPDPGPGGPLQDPRLCLSDDQAARETDRAAPRSGCGFWDPRQLGAGFTLASQDLDIRGAGNLLGEEQSGQINEVGYELYQSMLEEAIAKIKAGRAGGAERGRRSMGAADQPRRAGPDPRGLRARS